MSGTLALLIGTLALLIGTLALLIGTLPLWIGTLALLTVTLTLLTAGGTSTPLKEPVRRARRSNMTRSVSTWPCKI